MQRRITKRFSPTCEKFDYDKIQQIYIALKHANYKRQFCFFPKQLASKYVQFKQKKLISGERYFNLHLCCSTSKGTG